MRAKRTVPESGSRASTATLNERFETYGKGCAGSTASGVSTGKMRASNSRAERRAIARVEARSSATMRMPGLGERGRELLREDVLRRRARARARARGSRGAAARACGRRARSPGRGASRCAWRPATRTWKNSSRLRLVIGEELDALEERLVAGPRRARARAGRSPARRARGSGSAPRGAARARARARVGVSRADVAHGGFVGYGVLPVGLPRGLDEDSGRSWTDPGGDLSARQKGVGSAGSPSTASRAGRGAAAPRGRSSPSTKPAARCVLRPPTRARGGRAIAIELGAPAVATSFRAPRVSWSSRELPERALGAGFPGIEAAQELARVAELLQLDAEAVALLGACAGRGRGRAGAPS